MSANLASLTKIVQLLDVVSQRRATGELLISGDNRQWQLYFFQGRLFFATSNLHRTRRWQRVLASQCPSLVHQVSAASQPWEYHTLIEGILQGQLGVSQAQELIQTIVLEVFFELVGYPTAVTSRWQAGKPVISQIPPIEAQQALQKAQQLWEQWQVKELGHLSPNLAPVCKKTQAEGVKITSEASLSLTQLLDGQHTIWDIAYRLRQPAWAVTLSLLSLVRKGVVELKEIPDLPSPVQKSTTAVRANSYSPLIACIDDSRVIGQTLEKILLPAGYRLLKITEPLREMSTLVQHKPDLIFLDLVMPDTSGHSLCTFLRSTPVFQKTPIIILTSQDSLVNRSQAKFTGASDFLSKPPEAKKVLQVIHKHLPTRANPKSVASSVVSSSHPSPTPAAEKPSSPKSHPVPPRAQTQSPHLVPQTS